MESTNDVVLDPDQPPKNGVWVETCEVLPTLTQEEIDKGNALGTVIDPEDDDDPGTGPTHIKALMLSGRESAMQKAQDLKRVMLAFGVPEVSVELQMGRPSSYDDWDSLYIVSDMSHHTVSRYSSTSRTPCLYICKHGRSDLPGPLCNGYGGWDLCYRILTFGYANHPGEGGPKVVPALHGGSFTVPKDSARRYAWGTEFEGGLAESDWDRVITNPRNGISMTFREFMGRSNMALQVYHQIHQNAHMEHSTWTPRKIDRLHYTAAKGIAEKLRYEEKDWFDMATADELRQIVQEELAKLPSVSSADINIDGIGTKWSLQKVLRHLLQDVAELKKAKGGA